MDHADYDVVVVGGGIIGAAAARALTRQGYRILLLEQADFASGSTAASTRLIQGGGPAPGAGPLRQLPEATLARERLLRSRPHLVQPQPFLLPVFAGDGRSPSLVRARLALNDLLTPRKVAPWSRGFSLREVQRLEPSLTTTGLRAVYRFHDALVEAPERLCIAYLAEAREAGADLRNYASVDFIVMGDGGASAVDFHDVHSGRRHTATTRVVLNAAGPWLDAVLQATSRPLRPRLHAQRGSHVVVDLEGRGPSQGIVAPGAEGRPIFVIPWLGHHVVGTMEAPVGAEEVGAVHAPSHEIDALLDAAEQLLPGVGMDRAHALYAYAGVWPRGLGSNGAPTQGWAIIDHAAERAPGLLSVVGGSLTTAERTGQRAVRMVREALGRPPRRRRPQALPPRAPTNLSFLPPETVAHLRARYGQRSPDVAAYAGLDPELAELISPAHADIGAQVVYALEHEGALTVGDVLLRRTPVGLTHDLGRAAAPRVAAIMQGRMGWSEAERAQAVRDYDLELQRRLTVLRPRPGQAPATAAGSAGAAAAGGGIPSAGV